MSKRLIKRLKTCERSAQARYRASGAGTRALIDAPLDGGRILVISDLHLAEGKLPSGAYASLENFFADGAFDRMFAATQTRQQRPDTLVINGDFIDFPRIRFCPRRKQDFEQWAELLISVGVRDVSAAKLEQRISDRDRELGMNTERDKSVLKFSKAIEGHASTFDRLARWLMAGNRLFIVKGNTDLEFYFKEVRDLLRLTLARRIAADQAEGGDQQADELSALNGHVLPRLFFIDDVVTFGRRIHLEHGHRYDPLARVPDDQPLLRRDTKPPRGQDELNLPFSALSRRYLLNRIEERHPYLDNIRPRANLLPILIRTDFPLALKLLVKHLPFFFYSLRRTRLVHSFRRALQALLLLVALLVPALVAGYLEWQSLTELARDLQRGTSSAWLSWVKNLIINGLPLTMSYLLTRLVAFLQLVPPTSLHAYAWPIFADDRQLRYVAFGHTHAAEQIRHEASTFFNTGSWVPIVEDRSPSLAGNRTLHVLLFEPDATGELAGNLLVYNDDAGRLDPVIILERDSTAPTPSNRADPTAISRYELPSPAAPTPTPDRIRAGAPEPEQLELTLKLATPHGQRIDWAHVELVGGDPAVQASADRDGAYRLTLQRAGDYQLVISCFGDQRAFDLRTLRASVFYVHHDGRRSLRVLAPDPTRGRFEQVCRSDAGFEVHAVIEYLWFSDIGYAPRLGNRVELLHDGEHAWAAVARAIASAQRTVHLTTWIYQPSAELLRPNPLSTAQERRGYTVQEILQERAQAGATVRLLLWDAPFVAPPALARRAANTADDNFEVLQQHNPTERPLLKSDEWGLYSALLGNFQIGSYHQKSVVVDGRIGFCGGMNLKENDWDKHHHELFEPSRCHFDRPASFREQVRQRLKQPDHPPRHDFMARLTGPAVHDLERNFQQRWNHLIATDSRWADKASSVELPSQSADEDPLASAADSGEPAGSASRPPSSVPAPVAACAQVQVVRTMPEPFNERGILDVYLRAIRNARRYIYIEDQYFRSTAVSDEIADAARRWPELHVLVVTSKAQAQAAYAGWTVRSVERIKQRKANFELYTLMSHGVDDAGEAKLVEIDNHAKLMLVDDIFMTVGSCNINDRGFEFEGELNVAIVDRELVSATRVQLWREHLRDPSIGNETNQIDAEVARWQAVAEANRSYQLGVEPPRGRVFPFLPSAGATLVEYDVA